MEKVPSVSVLYVFTCRPLESHASICMWILVLCVCVCIWLVCTIVFAGITVCLCVWVYVYIHARIWREYQAHIASQWQAFNCRFPVWVACHRMSSRKSIKGSKRCESSTACCTNCRFLANLRPQAMTARLRRAKATITMLSCTYAIMQSADACACTWGLLWAGGDETRSQSTRWEREDGFGFVLACFRIKMNEPWLWLYPGIDGPNV